MTPKKAKCSPNDNVINYRCERLCIFTSHFWIPPRSILQVRGVWSFEILLLQSLDQRLVQMALMELHTYQIILLPNVKNSITNFNLPRRANIKLLHRGNYNFPPVSNKLYYIFFLSYRFITLLSLLSWMQLHGGKSGLHICKNCIKLHVKKKIELHNP